MSAQRYERVRPPIHHVLPLSNLTLPPIQVAGHDDETTTTSPHRPSVPSSPPPSFRSRASSFAHHNTSESERLVSDADRTLADTFDAPSDDDSSDDGRSRSHTHRPDERQRALSARPGDNSTSSPEHASDTSPTTTTNPPTQPRRTTQLSSFFTPRSSATTRTNQAVNDGVFANLSAKPTRGEEADEKPPVSHPSRPHTASRPTNIPFPRPTNRPPPTPLRPTGRRPSSPRAPRPTTSTSTASPSAPSSPSSGTA